MPLCEQLADDRQPGLGVEFGSDAEGLELVVAKAPDALGGIADQHIGQMMRAKPLPGAIDRRQRLLRRHRAVPAFRPGSRQLSQLPQGSMVALAEIAEQHLAATRDRLAKADQRLGFLALDAALPLVDVAASVSRRKFITSAMP
jgi:hypothetical protein